MTIYAHSHPDHPGDPAKWQELDDHLRNVAERAAEFAKGFGSADWAWNAGWLHDLGKADSAFQCYLRRENGLDDGEYDSGKVNHSSAGAAFAEETLGKCAGRVLAYLSAGHHAGLPDWNSADSGNAALSIRLVEGRDNLSRILSYAVTLAPRLRPVPKPPEFVRKAADFHLWIRMLYSCLVDGDFLDTEQFMQPEQGVLRFGAGVVTTELKTRFDEYMRAKVVNAGQSQVNDVRQEILAACREAATQAPGLFSLTVPTGGGKTLSSMAFALEHAVRHGKKRIIYVIPYTSIIEQTAAVLVDVFGVENVIEHHSNLDPDRETLRSRLASENWDAPIVVTTNVQFYESLYGARSGSCRKLHNLVDCVVVLDEAQLIPPELLTPCVDVMNQLVRNYGITMVLATATQPALPGLDKPKEIIPSSLTLYDRLKRVEYSLPMFDKRMEWADVAECLNAERQVLCVVNKRRDCHDLHKLMPVGTVHLSALMCAAHRSEVIAFIKERLKKNEPVRVVSTQLVEAGVDIDFPVVYRSLTGLDSIAQAAGRCNREGRLRRGQVRVFVPPEPSPCGLLRKREDTAREMFLAAAIDLHQPEVFSRYFELLYPRVNDTGVRFRNWLERDATPSLVFQFRTAAMDFRLIRDETQRSVFIRYGGSPEWLGQLQAIGPTRESLRRLQRYTVNLSLWDFTKALADGLVEEVWNGYWCWSGKYDDIFGLDIYGGGRSPQDLII